MVHKVREILPVYWVYFVQALLRALLKDELSNKKFNDN